MGLLRLKTFNLILQHYSCLFIEPLVQETVWGSCCCCSLTLQIGIEHYHPVLPPESPHWSVPPPICINSYLLPPPQSHPAAVCPDGYRGWRTGTRGAAHPGCRWWPGCRPSARCSSPGCTYPSSAHTSSSPLERPIRPGRSYSPSPSKQLWGRGTQKV